MRSPLPTFLVIGAQKSATRWLRHNLGKHPDVFTVEHEIAFFNRSSYRQGVDWYREQFAGWSGQPIVGEATPGYTMYTQHPGRVARRIRETMPDVRLIAILREPVDRANSAMVHHMKRGRIPKDARLLDLVEAKPPEDDKFGLISGGWYGTSLHPYQRLFADDQLLILLHDDVVADPRRAYERALRHIGATPDFVPSDLDQVVFSNQRGSSAKLRREVSSSDRLVLFEYFRKDLARLKRMFGLDLEHWDPARFFRDENPTGWMLRAAASTDASADDTQPRQRPVA